MRLEMIRSLARAKLLLFLFLIAPSRLEAHDGGPPTMTLDVGQTGVYVIKSDVTSEGDLSFYLAHEGFDTNVVRVAPQGTFASFGDGEFVITALAPGKTTMTFGWLYPPHDAGGLFTLEVTVNPPATKPPTAANAVRSALSGDPVNLFTGELVMMEPPDLNLGGPMPLSFTRYYASGLSRDALLKTPLGDNWSHNFNWRLLRDGTNITVGSWDGRRIPFQKNGSVWKLTGLLDILFQLVENGTQFVLGDPRGNRLYTFNGEGDLVAISDTRGNVHTLTYEGGRLSQVSDGLGRTLKFSSGGFQQMTAVSDGTRTVNFGYTNIVAAGLQSGSFKIFDQYFALFSVSNPLGNTGRYQYDGSGSSNHIRALLTAKVRPLGNIPYAQTWNSHGQVETQTESGTNVHRFFYDGASTLVTNPLGRTRKVLHTAGGQLATLTDEVGESITILSNTNGQRASVTDRRGSITGFGYHPPSGNVAAMTNADGTISWFEFAARTNNGIVLYETSRIIYSDGATENFTHDSNGNLTQLIDRAGKVWRLTWNNRGQVLTVSNPLGGQATFIYHPNGTLASRGDTDSGLTRFEYDTFGRMTNAIRPDGSTVRTVYDANDRVVSVTDERGNRYRYGYDSNDNPVEVIDPDGNPTRYGYDKHDRVTQVTDRLGNIVRLTYDTMENLSGVVTRNGQTIMLDHDPRQRLSALTDPGGKRWNFSYDGEAILTTWANPRNETQAQQSDALGFPIAHTDAVGRKRTMTRNHLQLVTATVDELARTNSRSYDSRGLLTSLTKPVIGSAEYGLNDLGQVTRAVDPTGFPWVWEHTPMGRLQKETDPLDRSSVYQYDSRGRLALTTFADGSTRQTSYDARNNPAVARFTDGTELKFTYDALNRLVQANEVTLAYDAEGRITNTVSSNQSFGASYDAGGRLISVTCNNAAFTVTYEYDDRDRLTRVSDSLSGTQISFTYDDAGRMIGMTRPNGSNGTYTYDPVGRLTRIQEGSFIDLGYTLDPAGQVTQINHISPLDPAGLIAPVNGLFTYDAARQISNPGYTYDARGRLAASPGQTFAYDGASRLTRIGAVTMAYNGLDDIISRTEAGKTTRYYYNYAIGMGPITAEANESGEFVRYYVWSPGGRLLYLADASTGKATYFHFDRAGSTLALTDDRGTVTDSYAYSPYGRLLGRSGNSTQPFTFVGRYGARREGEDLYQMRARYYSATTGSFLTRDLLPARFHDLHSLNPYHYVAGDPLRAVDPEGLDRTIWFFGHAWIEVDTYDAQGRKTGRVALNFAPESGKSDYQVYQPRNIVYPHLVGYDIQSSQLDDELLVREWRRLQKDETRDQQWDPIHNCIWKSVEYANKEIPMTAAEAKKFIDSVPLPNDLSFNAAPPPPFYKRPFVWLSDTWGDFEEWLEKALD